MFSQNGIKDPINCSNKNAYLASSEFELIEKNLENYYPDGGLVFNTSMAEELGLQGFVNLLNMGEEYTFTKTKDLPYVFDSTRAYFFYQEYYNGIKVEGGGFTVLARHTNGGPWEPTNPCASFHEIGTSISSDISVSTNPSILASELDNIVSGTIQGTPELIITHNIEESCEYYLMWEVRHLLGSGKISWVNAHNGDIIKTIEAGAGLIAETIDYGQVDIGVNIGEFTTLDEGDSKIYNLNSLNDPKNLYLWTENLIPKINNTTNPSSWGNTAPRSVYQLGHVAKSIVPKIKEFENSFLQVNPNFIFPNIEVFHFGSFDENQGAKSYIPFEDVPESFAFISELSGHSMALYDIVAHEVGHSILRELLDIQYNSAGQKSIHEGFSDIFGTYIESKIVQGPGPWIIDWVMGDDNPSIANHSEVQRNLSNPKPDLKCYTDVVDETNYHKRSVPFGHWFYLIAKGNSLLEIPALGLEKSMCILMTAMSSSAGKDFDYYGMMWATLRVVDEKYGLCSTESISVRRAWETICVIPDHLDFDGCDISVEGIGFTSSWICEETDHFKVCAAGNDVNLIPSNAFRWTIIGQKSVNYVMNGNQSGNSQHGGSCLEVVDIPDLPYYPQIVTIQLYVQGYPIDKKRIKLIDCDHDDPTCEEYFNQSNLINNTESLSTLITDKQISFVEIYDIYGRKLYSGSDLDYSKLRNRSVGIVIKVSYNKFNQIVNTAKLVYVNE